MQTINLLLLPLLFLGFLYLINRFCVSEKL